MRAQTPERELISRNQAARLLKKSPRSIGRMVERGELTRTSEGFFDRLEVEELADIEEETESNSSQTIAVTELREGHAQAIQHVERMMQLLEKPIQHALETVTRINENLLGRLTKAEETQLEYLRVLGDHLLQKDEREAMLQESLAKQETIREAGKLLKEHLPALVSQLGGKSSAVVTFFSSLEAEEKEHIAALYWHFDEGPKRDAFKALLEAAGAEVPPMPEDMQASETKTEETEEKKEENKS